MAKGNPGDAFNFEVVSTHADGPTISSATTLTPPTGATKILIQALTQNVRVTLDGTNPTATLGFQLKAGDPPLLIPLGNSTVLKVIEEAATADLQYQWGGG
jgi:hypothetical protein